MLFFSKRALLSALWRPHSEQIKFWLADTSKDNDALPLARSYIHGLELKDVLATLDDGIELIDLLKRIKYPRGSHVVAQLSQHIEDTSKELTVDTIRQLAANVKLSGDHLEYYEASLNKGAFMDAFSRCLCEAQTGELVQLALSFSATQVHGQDSGAGSVIFMLCRAIAKELAARVRQTVDEDSGLPAIVVAGIPLERQQWSALQDAVYEATQNLQTPEVLALLHSIATKVAFGTYRKWCFVIQTTLARRDDIATSDVLSAIADVVQAGGTVHDALNSQLSGQAEKLTVVEVMQILSAWREARFQSSNRDVLDSAFLLHLQAKVELHLRRGGAKENVGERLSWLLCLAHLSPQNAAALLDSDSFCAQFPSALTASDVALLCHTMVLTESFPVPLIRHVCKPLECNPLDQTESVAVLFVLQKCGNKAPEKLLRKAVGRLGARLVSTRHQSNRQDTTVPSTTTALLLASLCFVDDAGQGALLSRLLQQNPVTPGVAMWVLRHTRAASTKAAHYARPKLIKAIVGAANDFRSEELGFIMLTLADLKIRDVGVFEQLLCAMQDKAPSAAEVAMAARAATSLRLSSVFARSGALQSPTVLSGVSPADFLSILRCCERQQRRQLLSRPEFQALLAQTPLTNASAAELVVLLVIVPAGSEQRKSVTATLKTREALMADDIDGEDVVAALECATTADEIDSICKACFRIAHNLTEEQARRLLRCARGYKAVPKSFFRLAGKALLSLSSADRISPDTALMWTELYVEHQVQDGSVGRCLVSRALKNKQDISTSSLKLLHKAAKFYGLGTDSFAGVKKKSKKKSRNISADYEKSNV